MLWHNMLYHLPFDSLALTSGLIVSLDSSPSFLGNAYPEANVSRSPSAVARFNFGYLDRSTALALEYFCLRLCYPG